MEEDKAFLTRSGQMVPLFTHLNVLPIIAGIIFAVTCILPFFISLIVGRHFPLTIPTVSESAREFPGSRVFSMGCTIVAMIVGFSGVILLEIPSLHGPSLPRATKLLPVLVAVFLILLSGFGLDDNVFIHLTCALVGFFSVMCFCGLFFCVFAKLNLLAMKKFRFVVFIVGAVSLALLALTWPGGNVDPLGSIKSTAEFSFILCFAVFVFTTFAELADYQLVLEL